VTSRRDIGDIGGDIGETGASSRRGRGKPRGTQTRRATPVAIILAGVVALVFGIDRLVGGAEPPLRAPVSSTSTGAGGAGGSSGADDTPKVKVERGAGGKKIYRITEDIRIEGKIQKPEAFFFYQKSSINYDWQEMKQDFVPRILESVNRAPF
jgi:hypothetical protein